ncbi:Protein of unknown function [Flaviramulus basaltis]|uniref:DUF3050 domain-containing protein n=1 Tax=Flaviramulus basaltis TaxID=369401 RepID=A0A1K2IB04_9FLAO|nr:DUF3050 domain-containing protein [Flaviramulus basaltis]SFZ89569.1 Protein of unknown function [Flaviramulus basaltis]
MTIEKINKAILPYQKELLNHSLYNKIKTVEDLQVFLQNHVFAVWDFMSLLKALQNKLTCTTTPWMPIGNPETRYLINEIVLAEETDIDINGNRQSHYELYIDAMKDAKANTSSIASLLESISETKNVFVAIKNCELDNAVKDFLNFTFQLIDLGESHQIAAAFTFGREDLIPSMFTEILKNFQNNLKSIDLSKLIYYFERHIELDADEHGPMAMKMITELCGSDAKKWQEVEEVSIIALQKRIALWNAIELLIEEKNLILN